MAAIFAPSSRNSRNKLRPIPPAAPVIATTWTSNVMRCPAPSSFHRPFQKPFEEQLLSKREGEDARGYDDHVDGGKIRPRPLPLSALGGGENHRHGAFGLVVDQRHAEKIFSPGGDEIDDEDYHQAVAHH